VDIGSLLLVIFLADLILPMSAWYLGEVFDKASGLVFVVIGFVALVFGLLFWLDSRTLGATLLPWIGGVSAILSLACFVMGRIGYFPGAKTGAALGKFVGWFARLVEFFMPPGVRSKDPSKR
jgi:hypothetical protein